MAEFRCMKHDRIFEAFTDIRKPGANENETMPAHPAGGGHPDCPMCQQDAKGAKASGKSVVSNV